MKRIWDERIEIATFDRAYYSKRFDRIERLYCRARLSATADWDQKTGTLRVECTMNWDSNNPVLEACEHTLTLLSLAGAANERPAVYRRAVKEIDAFAAQARGLWEMHGAEIDMGGMTDEQVKAHAGENNEISF